jgi:hypothetical protein
MSLVGATSGSSDVSSLGTSTSKGTATTSDVTVTTDLGDGYTKTTTNVTNSTTGAGTTTDSYDKGGEVYATVVTKTNSDGTSTATRTDVASDGTKHTYKIKYDNPDGDVTIGPLTDAQIEDAIVLQNAIDGGDVIEGGAGGIERVSTRVDLVGDPSDSDESGTDGGVLPKLDPGNIDPVNPSGPLTPPVPGDDPSLQSGSAAMTASAATDEPGISLVGSSDTGIQSVEPAAPDGAVAAVDMAAAQLDTSAAAVDSFAADYLGDAATTADVAITDGPTAADAGIIVPETDRPAAPELQADLVSGGLVADLGSDLARADDSFAGQPELIDQPIDDGLAIVDDLDDGLDDGFSPA